MGNYDTMQVCLKGHQITECFNLMPELRKNHCDICGEKTITVCPNCNQHIRGYYDSGMVVVGMARKPVPKHCHNCGGPYPWTSTEEGNKEKSQTKNSDPISIVKLICSRFHIIARQLRERYNVRPTLDVIDEYDVQDLLHALLKLHFDDIRPEEYSPSYAGGSSRMDFLLKDEKLVIEVKRTRNGLGAKEVGEQLIIDIEKYQRHPDCETLFCFVYDPEGKIPNPKALENDLARKEENLIVEVLIVPTGM